MEHSPHAVPPRRSGTTRAVLAAVLLLCALAGARSILAEGEGNPLFLPPDGQRAWETRLEEAVARIDSARQEFRALQTAYAKAQREEHPRGAARAALIERREAAHERLVDAAAALPALIESARRAGVYPEVLRPFRDRLDELTELPAAPADS